MRALAMRGGPYDATERQSLLDYCQTDVEALARLLPAMAPAINVDHALMRGRYIKAVATMEHHGIPIDTNRWALLQENWDAIQGRLIEAVDADYGVYEPATTAQKPVASSVESQPGGGSRPTDGLPTWRNMESHGRGWTQVDWLWTTKPFAKWRVYIPNRSGQSANCAIRSGNCG